MKFTPTHTVARLTVTMAVAVALLLFAAPDQADAQQGAGAQFNPCPNYSIQNVFDNPNSDWDRDRIPNGTELNYGENPCVPANAKFCQQQPTLCTFTYQPVSTRCSAGIYWNWAEVNSDPRSDWDRDGVGNLAEAKAGTNPCSHPCPTPSSLELALNPTKDWDNDGITNQTEIAYRTDPCRANIRPVVYYNYTPTPAPTPSVVVYQSNTPPAGYTCPTGYPYYNASTRLCYAFAQPIPKPTPVIAPSTPPAGYVCPAGYPYYHATTRLCHANRLS